MSTPDHTKISVIGEGNDSKTCRSSIAVPGKDGRSQKTGEHFLKWLTRCLFWKKVYTMIMKGSGGSANRIRGRRLFGSLSLGLFKREIVPNQNLQDNRC